MAKGRFISKEICVDKKTNDLKDPWSILGFTWLVTHADCEGRTYGDPAVVRAMIFPRQPSISVEDVERYIQQWHDSGLVIWYEAEGDMFIKFPHFSNHQVGLRKEREPSSTIPDFTADDIRQLSDNHPAEVNVIKDNVIKDNVIKDNVMEQEQTTVVVSSKPKEKIPLKTKAASMLKTRMVTSEILKDLLQVYKPNMLIDYCYAYDQALSDGKADGPGWLIKALNQQWDIKALLKKRNADLLQVDPARYVTGQYAEFVEH